VLALHVWGATPCLQFGPACGVKPGALSWTAPVAAGRHRQAPQAGMGADQPAFQHVAHVRQQVPAVGNLDRLERADGGGAGVLRRAVACHHLDPGPLLQPGRDCCAGAVGQQVDHAPTLQVHHDRAVGASLAQRPVVHGHDPRRFRRRQWQPADEAQHRVWTGRHSQVVQQPCCCFAAQCRTDLALRLGQPGGPARMGRHQFRQALGKGASGAFGVAAVGPFRPYRDMDPAPDRRQVSRVPAIAAVHGTARASAVRVAVAGPGAACVNMEEVRAVRRDRLDAAARHRTKLVHALSYGHDGRLPQASVRNRYDSRKARENYDNRGGS
jgi:hypothetical protein